MLNAHRSGRVIDFPDSKTKPLQEKLEVVSGKERDMVLREVTMPARHDLYCSCIDIWNFNYEQTTRLEHALHLLDLSIRMN